MASSNAKRPAAKGLANGPRGLEQLGWRLVSENRPSLRSLQAQRLVQRFGLPTARAALVATLAFETRGRP